jgi:pyruvate-formate lyase-activating enzyme
MMRDCSHCEESFESHGGVIYCDSCRWDLHYCRNWHTSQHYTKEEWMNEQRRHRVQGYKGRWQ